MDDSRDGGRRREQDDGIEADALHRLGARTHDIEDVYRLLVSARGVQLRYELQLDVVERQSIALAETMRRVEARLQQIEDRVGGPSPG